MRRKYFIYFFIYLSVISFQIFSIEWPQNQKNIIKNFGFNNKGTATVGTVFTGDEATSVADTGEIIFMFSQQKGIPSPLGTWIAIDHRDGIIGIYGYLEHIPVQKDVTLVDKGLSLKQNGNSYFALYDRKEHSWINPALIIPLQDIRAPILKGACLDTPEYHQNRKITVIRERKRGRSCIRASHST